MSFYQITAPRLRRLEATWAGTFGRFHGAAPVELGIAHMLAESNGAADPVVRNIRTRPVGIMQVPYRVGRRYGYVEEKLKDPLNNIYVWGLATNDDSKYLHRTYPSWWLEPNLDFWLAVRLLFVLGHTVFDHLLLTVHESGMVDDSIAGVQEWVRTQMRPTQRFGVFNRQTLRRTMDHLDEVNGALVRAHGASFISTSFNKDPVAAPGGEEHVYATVTAQLS